VIRRLTSGEAALAHEVFGDRLPVRDVRILASPWPLTRAFVPGRWFGRDWIVWPRRSLIDDLALGSLNQQATLVHELVHVWQAQQGVNLLLAKLRAGDRRASYRYPLGDDCAWCGLNIEQQAMLVEHRFRLSRGSRAPMPAEFYDRVVTFEI
jgi:hypothetical protein